MVIPKETNSVAVEMVKIEEHFKQGHTKDK